MKPHNITDLFSASLADSQLSTKQQAVLKASLKLFSEQGYDRTSTQEIARVAQVSEGTVYKQFKTKEEKLVYIMHISAAQRYLEGRMV